MLCRGVEENILAIIASEERNGGDKSKQYPCSYLDISQKVSQNKARQK